MVTVEDVVRVQRQRDVAQPAATRDAAGAAVERRSDAASVEEQDRATPVFDEPSERTKQRRGERVASFAAKVDKPHPRERHADARGERRPPQARPALGARRRGAVDSDRALERRALRGDRPRVVARVGLLLEGRVVLLVDDDQPDAAHRREHGRARADDDARLAARDPVALVAPLGVAERGVEDRHDVPEARPKPAHRLRGERDLGHEHDRPEPARERRSAGLQVDLGLATARRPLEQDVLADPLVERGDDLLDRSVLVRRELGRLELAGQRLAEGR